MAEEEGVNKFAYLLQPLKDLEKNFQIDLVKILDDYNRQLLELAEKEQFEIDNATRFNFAEAAVLIQGSTCVFGRKVDHLHSQALHFFESLQAAKKKKKPANDDADGDEGIGGDDDADDMHSAHMFNPMDLQDFSKLKRSEPMQLVIKRRYKPIITLISVMPMSLMPLADFEKCNVPMYARRNSKETIGKKDDFKINTGYMGNAGSLLLDLKNGLIQDEFASDAFMEVGCKRVVAVENNKMEVDEPDSGRGSPDENAMHIDDIADGEFPGRGSTFAEVRRRVDGLSNVTNVARPSTVLLTQQKYTQDADSDFGGNDNDFGDDFVPPPLPAFPVKLPWEEDDNDSDPILLREMKPFETLKLKEKELKLLPASFSSINIVKKRKKNDENQDMRTMTLATLKYNNEHFYMRSKKIKANISTGWESESLFKYMVAQQKRVERAKREKRQRVAPERVRENDLRATLGAGERPYLNDDDHDDDFAGGADYDGDDFEFAVAGQHENRQNADRNPLLFEDIVDEELNNSINIPSLYLGRKPNGSMGDMGSERIGDLERPPSGMGTQEMLEYYMKKYWASAEEASTRIGARVQEWETRMLPLLEVEETRKEFDIHEYGSEMLDMFANENDEATLPKLLAGRKDYEISRYFLSCLMLTNTYNVQVIDDGEPNTMNVKLLKRDRHHEVFNRDGAL